MKEPILHTPKTLSFAKRTVKRLPQAIALRLPAEISVVPVSEKESLALNRRYRKKNKAANVLSFYYAKEYGEIIVCPAIIRAEAKTQNNSFEYQMTWMIVHGMIHLSGLHHEESKVAEKKFSRIEHKVLKQFLNGPPRHRHRS